MSSDMLLTSSLVMVGIALLCAVLTSLYDWKCSDDVRKNSLLRHTSKSPLSMTATGKVLVFLLYGATAYSSDIAFEWLSSIALMVFFIGMIFDRIMTLVMTKRGITPSDPAPQAESRQAAMENDEIAPEPLGEMLINIGGILITLIVWAALVSLIMLMAITFFETVVPHYVSALGVFL